MTVLFLCFFFVLNAFALVSAGLSGSYVLDLDVANFEKLTKVATGHTTGDWLVKFYAPWCEHSQKMAPVLEEVASELRGAVTVARVDVMNNRDIGTRFGIKGFPTLVLFSQGHMYTFKGRRSAEEIIEFARGGFQLHEPEITPQEFGIFGELFLVSRHAYKEAAKDLLDGNFYTVNVFCMALPIIFVILMLVVFFMPFASPERQPIAPPESARKATIPLSRRAKRPTTATDSSQRKVTKDD